MVPPDGAHDLAQQASSHACDKVGQKSYMQSLVTDSWGGCCKHSSVSTIQISQGSKDQPQLRLPADGIHIIL